MKGKLQKTENGWVVRYKDVLRLHPITQYGMKELPLHPYEAEQIEKDAGIFDNIEARIAANPDVEFTIQGFWETGMEEVVTVATLVNDDKPLEFLAKQAQELDMGYELSDTEYEKAAYWFGRGIHAGRNNMIKELQPKRKQ